MALDIDGNLRIGGGVHSMLVMFPTITCSYSFGEEGRFKYFITLDWMKLWMLPPSTKIMTLWR